MQKLLWSTYLKMTGWKIEGKFPKGVRKAIILAGPHTSNWDFPLGLATRAIEDFPAKFMIKDNWTKLPIFGKILLNIGAVPVDRSGDKKVSMTQATIDAIKQHDEFILCIAPEGTRKYQPKLKTGFWHIADETKIPIVPIALDWGNKIIRLGDPIYTSNKSEDIIKVQNFLGQYKGKIPEQGIRPVSK